MSTNSKNTIYDIKRLMGKKFSDETVQHDIKHFPFQVKGDEEDRPYVVIDYKSKTDPMDKSKTDPMDKSKTNSMDKSNLMDNSEEKKLYPEEISACILNKMKTVAETYLGKKVNNAVITVPAYF